MKIAVLSDTHDNIWVVRKVMERVSDTDTLIFCGDLCAPFTLAEIANRYQGQVHCVFGNNDGDPLLLSQVAAKAGNVTLHGDFADLNLGGCKIFVNHYPPIAEYVANAGLHDLVCCGHNHQAEARELGRTVFLNPGEVMGRFGRSTYAVYDTDSRKAQIHEVDWQRPI